MATMLEEPHAESPPTADHGDIASLAHAEWTERQLPPVKPPTAGLLVQLFFVPMIIVGIIVVGGSDRTNESGAHRLPRTIMSSYARRIKGGKRRIT